MSDSPMLETFEDARLLWPNFSGREGMYNRAGDRNFNVIIPEDRVDGMIERGWNVKFTKEREDIEDFEVEAFLPVSVRFDVRPPRITTITSSGRTVLSEDMVEVLDYADIEKIDLVVRSYEYTVNNKSGIKAYLKTMFVTMLEDDMERKYGIADPVIAVTDE